MTEKKCVTVSYRGSAVDVQFADGEWMYQHPQTGSWEQEPRQVLQGWSEQAEWEQLVHYIMSSEEVHEYMDQADDGDIIMVDEGGRPSYQRPHILVDNREGEKIDCEVIAQEQRRDVMIYLAQYEIGEATLVVEFPDGTQYTPRDWQAGWSEIPADLGEIEWLSQDGVPGVMLDGLPRSF